MKKFSILACVSVCVLGLPFGSQGAPKKEAADPAEKTVTKTKEMAKDTAAKVAGEPKAMGMYVKVDSIDAAAKTFSHTNKDGTVVKFMVTDKTEVKNGDAVAKLGDIKVGDTVSGSRIKKSPTEYEVVKITKFGPAPERKAKEPKAEGEKKTEKKKME